MIIEYPNTDYIIQQMLIEKCKREGITVDKVFFRSKTFLQTKHLYIEVSICY